RLVGRDRLRLPHPGNRLVGDVGGQVIVRIRGGRHEIAILEEDRVPVVHVTGIEPVEIVEAEAVHPAVEGTGGARLPGGRIVVLADPRGHVAVLPQHLTARAAAARQDAGVAVIARGEFGYAGERGGVVVAAGDQRRTCRTAERGGVKVVVPESLSSQL